MPDAHAKLSPSAAKRWMTCPASIRMTEELKVEDMPPESPYAVEGTRAHTLAELEARHKLLGLSRGEYLRQHAAWRKSVSTDEAATMQGHADAYVEYLRQAMADMPGAQLLLEQRVNTGVPNSWGTSDAVLVSPSRIRIVDFKYGAGVWVSAVENPQLMLYGCGALLEYGDVLGTTDMVEMSIFQPRLDNVSTWTMDAAALRAWRDSVIPIAEEALGPDAHFAPGPEVCQFCPAAGVCRPRMQHMTALDFYEPVDVLTNEDLAELLPRLADIRAWCQAVEEAALDRSYSQGQDIPGFKVVLSGGRRTVPDPTAAIQALIDKGYPAEQVARFQIKPLGELEKLVGSKERLNELLGPYVVKTAGRPSMVRQDDPRPPVSPVSQAQADFA